MSKRLQVIMPDADLEEVRDAARRSRLTVSAWVRRALRAEAERERRGGTAAVREARPAYDESPKPRSRRYVTMEITMMEDDLEAVRRRFGHRNWKEAVEEAVRREAAPPATKEEALAMEDDDVAVQGAQPVYDESPATRILRFVTIEVTIHEDDLEALQRRYGRRSWNAAVKEAVCRQALPPMTDEEALAMEGAGWDGDLDEMRDHDPVEVFDCDWPSEKS